MSSPIASSSIFSASILPTAADPVARLPGEVVTHGRLGADEDQQIEHDEPVVKQLQRAAQSERCRAGPVERRDERAALPAKEDLLAGVVTSHDVLSHLVVHRVDLRARVEILQCRIQGRGQFLKTAHSCVSKILVLLNDVLLCDLGLKFLAEPGAGVGDVEHAASASSDCQAARSRAT